MADVLYTQLRETALRATPEVQGVIIAMLPKGTALEVFEQRDGYLGVRAFTEESGQVSGYVFKSLVTPSEAPKEFVIEKSKNFCHFAENVALMNGITCHYI